MKKVVPLGVVYGERMDVPTGPEREQFLKGHKNPHKYAFFTDKDGLEWWNYKEGYQDDRRLPDYNSSDHDSNGDNRHFFEDTRLSDTDSLYYKKFRDIPKESDERYKLITNSDEHTTGRQIFYDARKRLLGTFKSATQWDGSVINYTFENNGHSSYADNEEKLYYEDDSDVAGAVPHAESVSGGRRKRKTNRKKNKNRRAKSRRQRRS